MDATVKLNLVMTSKVSLKSLLYIITIKTMLTKVCLNCWIEFAKSVTVSLIRWNNETKCCSSLCANTYRRWRQIPWNKWTKWACKAWNKWLKSPETSWPKNHAWTWTDDKYWKDKCKERDNFTCVSCWYREDAIMQVDHIKPKSLFPELRHSLENLQTLCPNCHARKSIKEKKSTDKKNSRLLPLST